VDETAVLANRIVVMRPHPGRMFAEVAADLPRPRDRQSAAFDHVKRRVLAALDRSFGRAAAPEGTDAKAGAGAALWLVRQGNLGPSRFRSSMHGGGPIPRRAID
jgi:sulfonate transport system ATP-binding protein